MATTYITLEDVARKAAPGTFTSVMVSEFRQSVLLDLLTFKNITSAHDEFRRETELPTPQRRGVHGSFTRTRSTSTIGTEGLRIFGTKMSLDRFLEQTSNFDIAAELRSHARAVRLKVEYEAIYGDPLDDSDPGQVNGLQFFSDHSSGFETETSVSAGSTAGGAALSLRVLQNAIDNCYPRATHLICGAGMRNVITGGSHDANVSGHINWTQDDYGRRIAQFDGLPIIAMDRDHLNRKILDFNEAAVSGSPTAGSIYIVSHLPQEGGWYPFQNGGPFVDADGQTAASVKERDLEWYVSFNRPQPTAVVRLKHIGNLAMVA